MSRKRDVLGLLKREELIAVADRFALPVEDRRVKGALVEALAGSRKAGIAAILEDFSRDRLKEICRALDLDDSGREKATIIARLAGDLPERPELNRPNSPTTGRFTSTRNVWPPPELPGTLPQPATTDRGPVRLPPKPKKSAPTTTKSSANIGYEAKLWQMADALRGSMDASEYKHVVLGLIFLKYISDAFEEQYAKLVAQVSQGADPEDPDEYRALTIFWVPPEARWPHLKAQARQSTIGKLVDDAMAGVERDNPVLKGVLPKDFARPALDKLRLGQLIDLISNIKVGDEESRGKDVIGRVYEYFLSQFASAEGKKGGEFYTPRCVVKLLVEMIEPYRGRVYDPCCGSSGMFVQSVEFIQAHATGNGNGGKAKADISVYGQESNYTTWRLARMNLAIRGVDGQIAHGDTFHNDRHPELKADFILANPPFNISDWGGERLRDDKRWKYGVPPAGNANFAWVQHIVHHLAPTGVAGFVLANGSMSSNQSGEGGDPQEPDRGRSCGLHGRDAGPTFLFDSDSCLSMVPRTRS
jgi:hypothetical protein